MDQAYQEAMPLNTARTKPPGIIDTRMLEGYNVVRQEVPIPSGDRKAVIHAVLFASENRDLMNWMAQEARSFVLKEYGLERLTRDLDALWRERLG